MVEASARKRFDDIADGNLFSARVADYRCRVEHELGSWLDAEDTIDVTLADAMRYALLGPGKRVRPLLVYASSELLSVNTCQADAMGAAIETIHTYSLVHDDLPAMDNDALRRGRPTVHIKYDEASAILVGDALQSLGFQILSSHPALGTDDRANIALVRQLATAIGASGMADGQSLDIACSGTDVEKNDLEEVFARKTGRLIGAAITMPLEYASDVSSTTRATLRRFAANAGLCFQIHDDVLELISTTERIGKSVGSDVRNDRASYPSRFGLCAARARANALRDEAMTCLDQLGAGAEGLYWLTEYIVGRDH
jgi:geranylgeranyl pyrophosphate synthase